MRIACYMLFSSVIWLGGCVTEETVGDEQTGDPGGKPDDPTDSAPDSGAPLDASASDDAATEVDAQASSDALADAGVIEIEATAFRIVEMTVADPHMFAYGLFDVTAQVNEAIATSVTTDSSDPPDGLLDLSVVTVMRPLDSTPGAVGDLDVVMADCTAPMQTTSCQPPEEGVAASTSALSEEGDCLAPIAGTTGGYSPAIVIPAGPCFATDEFDLEVNLGGVEMPLEYVRIGASYDGDPIDRLHRGLIVGFMTEEAADNAMLPDDLPSVGGSPLSSLLGYSDKDEGPDGTPGWWFYLNFTAETVSYAD